MPGFARPAALLAAALLCAAAQAADDELLRFEFRQIHMGVETRIVLYAPDESTARAAADAAFDRIAALEDIMSDYRAHSELMRLSAASGGPPVQVTEELFFVLRRSQEMAAMTGGAFDVTVGPVVRLWREARRTGTMPEERIVRDALDRVGWEKMVLDESERSVHLTHPGMQLDLGGIGKGYAADEAIAVLSARNITRALIEMGGDVVVSGPPPGREGWRISIANAPEGRQEIDLVERAASTSGDTEQYVEIAGTRYSHIVDPKTGLGLTHRLAVTVIGPDGITADAFATAVSVLGKEEGGRLLDSHPELEGFIVRSIPTLNGANND